MTAERLIYDLGLGELQAWLTKQAEPPYRAAQIWQGLYQQFWNSAEEFTTLPRDLRKAFAQDFRFSHLELRDVVPSADKMTEKRLFRLLTQEPIESVLMRQDRRRTLCISTQAGCAMGCVFCGTGQIGFRANLTCGEIIEQVIHFSRTLKINDEKITNIVFMGMGEPFHNYDESLHAADRLNDPGGFNFGARRITLSTVGIIPMIERFTREKRRFNLAVSLHAADDDLRNTLIPINRKYPIRALMKACSDYVQNSGRRITFEWALIHQVNDTQQQAHKLVELLRGLRCHVNLIPLNSTFDYDGKASSNRRVMFFKDFLATYNIPCSIRARRGVDIHAGCGQLAAGQLSEGPLSSGQPADSHLSY